MTTHEIVVAASEKQMREAFESDSALEGYKRISGNYRWGTYVADIREGHTVRIGSKEVAWR